MKTHAILLQEFSSNSAAEDVTNHPVNVQQRIFRQWEKSLLNRIVKGDARPLSPLPPDDAEISDNHEEKDAESSVAVEEVI